MLDTPRVRIAYTVVSAGLISGDYCSRFVGSWLTCPPGVDCDLVAVCNGGPLPTELAMMFSAIPTQFFPRSNDNGWDISGFQDAASKFDCDMLVCLGESCYFHKPGWLVPVVEAWRKYGAGFYGFFSSHLVRPHLNTTAFAVDTKFLKGYPQVVNHRSRYDFEHGLNSLWRRMDQFGRPVKLVTWDGVWDQQQWRYPNNIMWRGNQSNCLIFCNHVDRWFAADEPTRKHWSAGADQVPR